LRRAALPPRVFAPTRTRGRSIDIDGALRSRPSAIPGRERRARGVPMAGVRAPDGLFDVRSPLDEVLDRAEDALSALPESAGDERAQIEAAAALARTRLSAAGEARPDAAAGGRRP